MCPPPLNTPGSNPVLAPLLVFRHPDGLKPSDAPTALTIQQRRCLHAGCAQSCLQAASWADLPDPLIDIALDCTAGQTLAELRSCCCVTCMVAGQIFPPAQPRNSRRGKPIRATFPTRRAFTSRLQTEFVCSAHLRQLTRYRVAGGQDTISPAGFTSTFGAGRRRQTFDSRFHVKLNLDPRPKSC